MGKHVQNAWMQRIAAVSLTEHLKPFSKSPAHAILFSTAKPPLLGAVEKASNTFAKPILVPFLKLETSTLNFVLHMHLESQ